ncbi:response regulator [Lujinxingia vulgaris]|uniref:histidine kinase n=1 Tax=Lujinxingia vulgaris TaxID=2600176 RepID=A0A5C6XA46_9DELT|nr:ATP-binding protein [Lujinxingia vulgaris]TXD34908.1 response regulator [Lujinxingia vulgaris]
MSRPLSLLVYGPCPELDAHRLGVEVVRADAVDARSSLELNLKQQRVALIDGSLPEALDHIKLLRTLAPGCATLLIAEAGDHRRVLDALELGLTDFLVRSGEAATDRVLVEHLLKRSFNTCHIRQRLHDGERRFWTLFDSAPLGMQILGLQGQCEHANTALQELLGYSLDELRRTALDELMAEEDADLWRALIEELRQSQRDLYSLELRLKHRDGELRYTRFTLAVMREESGDPSHILAMVADLTDKKRIQQNLQHADKMQAMGRLAGGVAHDFNNLLTIIGSHCYIMRDALSDPPRVETSIEAILSASERGGALTRQLLTFGRRHVRESSVLDLNELLEEMRMVLQSLFGSSVHLSQNLATDLHDIVADRSQIEQVIMNLAINARDAMPQGGRFSVRTANLEVTRDDRHPGLPRELRPGHYATIIISDSGHGMPPEIKNQIFEPFFTTKALGQGTGLGLSTVYGVVTQDGGHISVESVPDQGTTFTIYLPAARQESTTPARLRRARRATPIPGDETILLVEDDDALRQPIRMLLERKGYHVLEAANAEEALELSRTYGGPIDLLLSDVIMPGLDGLALSRRITSTRPETAVLLMSGYTADALLATETGDLPRLLQKPFGMDTLTHAIRALLSAP